jgi:hypothetical protein
MCPAIFKGSRALSIKKSVVVTACNKAHVFPRHDRTLPRRLQNVRTYGVIMTYKLCRQALQHRATMHHRAADRSWAWWAEATIRQDGATLGYDPTGQLRCRLLTTGQDRQDGARHAPSAPSLPCGGIYCPSYCIGVRPRATCRALSLSVTVQTWTIKGRTDDRSRQTLLGKFNPLEQYTQHYNNPLCGYRVLRSGGLKHVNHRVHPT